MGSKDSNNFIKFCFVSGFVNIIVPIVIVFVVIFYSRFNLYIDCELSFWSGTLLALVFYTGALLIYLGIKTKKIKKAKGGKNVVT